MWVQSRGWCGRWAGLRSLGGAGQEEEPAPRYPTVPEPTLPCPTVPEPTLPYPTVPEPQVLSELDLPLKLDSHRQTWLQHSRQWDAAASAASASSS